MKQLTLTVIFLLVGLLSFSQQYRNVNQKTNFVNGMKISDTLVFDSASVKGSGLILKLADTTSSNWRVIRAKSVSTDTSFFSRSANTLVPKTSTDTIGSITNAVVAKTFSSCVGEFGLDNSTVGLKTLIPITTCNIDTITYSDATPIGFQSKVTNISNVRQGTVLTLVGGFRENAVDSSMVLIDSPPLYLNGHDTLRYRSSITLWFKDANTIIELHRSDN
jgi:hypothetical protein